MASLDPNVATRKEFTLSLTDRPLPDNASASWKDQAEKLRSLYEKLAFHQAMEPNLQQTFMTPAASKNKVYFMWDFVGRTLAMLFSVPPNLPSNMPVELKELWSDVIGRSVMAAQMILDTKPGLLDSMVGGSHPGKVDNTSFGEDILSLARGLSS